MNNQRLLWADSLKGILIMLVVLGHAIQEVLREACFDNHVWNIIYSFHMPAFMAVSGYLNYRTGDSSEKRSSIISRRFQQLLIPFFIWALIRVLVNPPYTIHLFANIILYPDGSFWFLWVLFFISVIFIFGGWLSEITRIKQEYVNVASVFILAGIMVLVNIRVLGFQFIAYYYLFYSFGYYLHKYSNLVISNTFVLLLLTIIWAVMAWFWNMHELPVFFSGITGPVTLVQYAYRLLTAFIAICLLLGISPKLLNNMDGLNIPFVHLGKISLGIYTTHILLMPFVVSLLKKNGMTSLISLVVCSFIIALLLSCLLVWLMKKWKLTNRYLLGKI